MRQEGIEDKVLGNYGFEYINESWLSDGDPGAGYWRSATHKVVKHDDDRYSIFQFGEIRDYDAKNKMFTVANYDDLGFVCYFGMIDWEDEEYCDKLLTMLGAIIELDEDFDDIYGLDEPE